MIFLVPSEFESTEVVIVPVKHPKSGKSADFVVREHEGKLFQVVTVNDKLESEYYKSVVVDGGDELSIQNGQLRVLIPVNPVFILLPALWEYESLFLEELLEASATDETISLPISLATVALQNVAIIDDGKVTLDREKLDNYLMELISKVTVPESLAVRELDEEYIPLYQKHVGVSFISSWLPPTLEAHLRSLVDLTSLETHVANVIKKRDEANTIFMLTQVTSKVVPGKRRGAPKKPESLAKRPADNRSLLDMFRKK